MQIEVDGATLYAAMDGPANAPPVLHWNGAMCAVPMWDRVVERLADRYRMLRFDIRGIGRSSPSASDEQYDFRQYADDACAILDAFDVQRANLWAMAWGSRAAIAFAARYPERVERAALFDASIGVADVRAQAAGHERALELQAQAGIAPFDRPVGWNVHDDGAAARKATSAAARADLSKLVDRLSMPVLVATGDQDPNLASSREIVARVTGARLVVMENVGHGSVLQRPDLTAEVFDAFLQETPKPG